MRLTCPNCGAQYEVGEDVIPDSGRDVQCSSCGNTWFQKSAQSKDDRHAHAQPDLETDGDRDVAEAAVEPVAETPAAEPEVPDPSPEAPEPPAPKTGMTEDVADILRSEAEIETAQRATEDGPVANITDPIANRYEEEISKQAEQVDVDMSDATTGTRSDLLPDIEEINSTLSAEDITDTDADGGGMPVAASKNGFRRGFIIAVVVFSILALVYVFAREIADAIPQLASPLSSYVDWVNQLRESVDSLMLKAVDKLTAILGQLNGDSTA